VQTALHQEFRPALAHHLHCPGRGVVAVLHVDDLDTSEVDLRTLRNCGDLGGWTDQDRRDQPVLGGLDRPRQRGLLTRMRDRGGDRVDSLASVEELFVFSGSGCLLHEFACTPTGSPLPGPSNRMLLLGLGEK
jgi:hypothetical protein